MSVTAPDRRVEIQGSLFNDSVPVLMAQKKEIEDRIRAIQDACAHPGATKVPKADTGNWCREDDRYWYERECPACLKRWTEDQ